MPPLKITALAVLLASTVAARGDESVRLELNKLDSAQAHCRLSFLVENRTSQPIQSFKVDLVTFDRENTMKRRLLVELAPIRRGKTMVRTFEIEQECGGIGGILVNDVAACVPGEPEACLDRLTLTSRAKDVRLFK